MSSKEDEVICIKHVHHMWHSHEGLLKLAPHLTGVPSPICKYHYCYWYKGEKYSLIEMLNIFGIDRSTMWEVCKMDERFHTQQEAEHEIMQAIMKKHGKSLVLHLKTITIEKPCQDVKCYEEPKEIVNK